MFFGYNRIGFSKSPTGWYQSRPDRFSSTVEAGIAGFELDHPYRRHERHRARARVRHPAEFLSRLVSVFVRRERAGS